MLPRPLPLEPDRLSIRPGIVPDSSPATSKEVHVISSRPAHPHLRGHGGEPTVAGRLEAIARAGDDGVTEDGLADRLGYQNRYVQVWCQAAFAFEVLDWDTETGSRLAPHMAALLLDPTDPQFLGGRVQFYTELYEDFRAYPETLRTGRIWPRSAHDPWLLEALKNLTKPDAGVFIDGVLPPSQRHQDQHPDPRGSPLCRCT